MTPPDTTNQSGIINAKDENTRSFNSHFGIVLFFIISLVFIVVGIVTSVLFDKNYSFFLWCLFFIPIVIHGIGWRSLHQNRPKPENKKSIHINNEVSEKDKELIGLDKFCGFYNVTMLTSVALYCIAWISYNKSNYFNATLWVCSLFCIVSIIIQFGITCYVTYTIMEVSHKRRKYTLFLRSGLELSPFWRFAHFFAIFMSISFLFGFAFAFHDLEYRKMYNKPALLVENIASDEDIEKKEDEERKKNESPTPTPTFALPNEVVNPQPFCFYFESGKANLIIIKEEKGYFGPKNDIEELEFKKFKKNYENLVEIDNQIKGNKSGNIPRLILIGSADDEPINANNKKGNPSVNSPINLYPSNYDLSEARIQATKNEITKELYEQNNAEGQSVDWLTVAHSNEEYTNQSKASENQIKKCQDITSEDNGTQVGNKTDGTVKNDKSGKRVVAVYLNMISPRQTATSNKIPNLMDYVYFSIYTISTTGYGDIKPATRYAKFLISLENFFEVFFLVCFMNTLIALKSESKKALEV